MTRADPVADANDDAREMARVLLLQPFAALAWTDPDSGTPGISRIALGRDPAGDPVTLISALAGHFGALKVHPDCALMVAEPTPGGDPLAHPRLMIRARARFVDPRDPTHADLRAQWLKGHPKAALYVDFADFAFVRLQPQSALLNAGFAKAFRLTPADLRR